MGEIDPKEAMDEWMAAKKGLTISEGELKAAQAGYSVAAAIEREAWEKIAKLCGREQLPPAPPQAPPVQVYAAPSTQLITAGRMITQEPLLSYRIPLGSATYYGSNAFDTRAR